VARQKDENVERSKRRTTYVKFLSECTERRSSIEANDIIEKLDASESQE
jgi:GTP-sensing pleiotropic transcriptional regulator CodY